MRTVWLLTPIAIASVASANAQQMRAGPDATAAKTADSLLESKSAKFEDYVRLIDRFEAKTPGSASLADRYPLVAYKRLLLLDRAGQSVRGVGDDSATSQQRAWIGAHGGLLFYYDPDAMWRVPIQMYWAALDSAGKAPWVEAAAWVVSQEVPGRDECGGACFLDEISTHGGEYWRRYPSGRHIDSVVLRAESLVRIAITDGDPADPPSRAAIADMRKSLLPVKSPAKARLLDALTQLERLAKPSSVWSLTGQAPNRGSIHQSGESRPRVC